MAKIETTLLDSITRTPAIIIKKDGAVHLTEGQAEEIARLSNAKQLVKFHFSYRYGEEANEA